MKDIIEWHINHKINKNVLNNSCLEIRKGIKMVVKEWIKQRITDRVMSILKE